MGNTHYRSLDSAAQVLEHVALPIRQAVLANGPSGKVLQIEAETDHPTIEGVEILRPPTFRDDRRTLIVVHNSDDPAGALGYSVIVNAGCMVGDHYHFQREERIVLLHGRAQFRLQDRRASSPTRYRLNLFTVDEPGIAVRIPPEVAHSIYADGGLMVLHVLASTDYSPGDDETVPLSSWR